MTYEEQIHAVLGFMYNETKCFATSSTYNIPYNTIANAYNIQISDKKVQRDITEEWCESKYIDKIQALDFDDAKEEVIVMIWETNAKKKYTLENYEEFCKEALQVPPAESFEDGSIDEDITNKALQKLNIDKLGLDYIDYRYLKGLIENFKGGPVGLDALAASISEEATTIEDVCEPFLLKEGFIQRTPRGRIATEKAYKHLKYKYYEGFID